MIPNFKVSRTGGIFEKSIKETALKITYRVDFSTFSKIELELLEQTFHRILVPCNFLIKIHAWF